MLKFIIVITESRRLGYITIPYLAEDIKESTSLNLIEQIDTTNTSKYDYVFSEEELQLLKILNKISDKYLFKYYGKEQTIKLFLDNIEKSKFDNVIRPHIEKNMIKAFEAISNISSVDLYYKTQNYNNVYRSDKIEFITNYVKPVFYFNLNDDGLNYSLKIRHNDKDIDVTYKKPLIITLTPCSLIMHGKLFRFEEIDSKKFSPFFDKKQIQVPSRSLPTYFKSFVLNTIIKYDVVNEGFDIIEAKTNPTAIISLEQNISQNPVLALKFKYSNKEYLANAVTKIAVSLQEDENKYYFTKYKRNSEWESGIIDFIKSLGLVNESGANYTLNLQPGKTLTEREIVFWLIKNSEILKSNNILIKQNTLEKKYFIGSFSYSINKQKIKDWFDIQIKIVVDKFEIPFIQLRKCILSGNNEYKLPNGEIFLIPDEWFADLANLLSFTKEENDKIMLKSIHFNLLNFNAGNKKSFSVPAEIDSSVPKSLKANLRDYQLQGFKWMSYLNQNNFGGILADDMGLGKTLQTITLLLKIYEENQLKNDDVKELKQLNLFDTSDLDGFNQSGIPTSLVVMPTSLIHNWHNELKKFAPSLKVYIYSGGKRLKSKEIGKILRHYHIVLSSYGILRNDIGYLSHYHFHYFILDESQYIKNPNSKIYEAICSIKCNKKLVLTGTPIENSLLDLWAQMNFVNNDLLGNISSFKRNFIAPIEKGKNEKQEEKLQKLIEPFVLRRTKEKVAKELPPVSEQILYCDMTKEQEKIYETVKSSIRNSILKNFEEEGREKTTFLALQGLTKLRLIANHPVFTDKEYSGQSGKFNTIIDNLDNIVNENHKVLVFSSFVRDLELIESKLKKKQIKYSKLTGNTKDRNNAVNSFEKDDECKVFLISLKAGGVGLNLISADYVFLLNPWWNPAAEAQAINRAHRIGQTKNVFVYKFISLNTIEEKIIKLQDAKSKLADTFINSNNPFKNLSDSDIKNLFN